MRRVLAYALVMLCLYPLGVICHELLGHGLAGVLLGGRVARAEILGLEIWPHVRWIGWQGHYGSCDVRDLHSTTSEAVMALAGSLSTWLVSVAALGLLYARRWSRSTRAVLICLGLWWLDMLTYALPSWGLHRSVLWGQSRFSEPYQAAVDLGLPGRYFQAAVVISSTLLLIAWIGAVLRPSRFLTVGACGPRPSSSAENTPPPPAASP